MIICGLAVCVGVVMWALMWALVMVDNVGAACDASELRRIAHEDASLKRWIAARKKRRAEFDGFVNDHLISSWSELRAWCSALHGDVPCECSTKRGLLVKVWRTLHGPV